MRKFLLITLLFFYIPCWLLAEEGHGSCVILGTQNDYVEVTAFSEGSGKGNFVIANSSSKPLMSVYITIKAEVKNGAVYELKTLYSGNYTEKVEPYQSKNVDFTYPNNYKTLKNISVEIRNPTCN